MNVGHVRASFYSDYCYRLNVVNKYLTCTAEFKKQLFCPGAFSSPLVLVKVIESLLSGVMPVLQLVATATCACITATDDMATRAKRGRGRTRYLANQLGAGQQTTYDEVRSQQSILWNKEQKGQRAIKRRFTFKEPSWLSLLHDVFIYNCKCFAPLLTITTKINHN